jgi:hypothetical protein
MSDDDQQAEQLARFREAVDRKSAAAEEASHQQAPPGVKPETIQGTQRPLEEDGRTQDVFSVRDKNSGHGHKTADKWNQ